MTWEDEAIQRFKQAMEQFKGKSLTCTLCGKVGKYDEDIVPYLMLIGEWGVKVGDTYRASVETSFMCKDYKACKQRREDKELK